MSTGIHELDDIITTYATLEDSKKIENLVRNALSKGIPVTDIMEKGLRVGLEEVGKKYEKGEYFLSELLFAASIMDDAVKVLKPELKKNAPKNIGSIVLGTIQGDIHDIGKNVFKLLAMSAGFEVFDLDVDVTADIFIEKIKETNAPILGISALLTTVLPEIKKVIKIIKEAGIRNNVKIILGGNAVTKEFAEEVDADIAALNAVEGVNICKKWMHL